MAALAAALAAGLSACGRRTKEEMIERVRNVETRSQLESALGRPDDIRKLGPVEMWTYQASNGQVVFLVVRDQVTLQATGTRPRP